MLVVTAAVPAERGALVIKALQKIVDARTDEREAHYQSLLEQRAVPLPKRRLPNVPMRSVPMRNVPMRNVPMRNVPMRNSLPNPPSRNRSRTRRRTVPGKPRRLRMGNTGRRRDGSSHRDRRRFRRRFRGRGRRNRGCCRWSVRPPTKRTICGPRWCSNSPAPNNATPTRSWTWPNTTGEQLQPPRTTHRPTRRGAHHRPQRARFAADGERRPLPCRPGLGASTKRTPAGLPATPTSTEFVQDAQGNLLNYERRRRIVPARLLRALKLRDRSRCRFPGCPHQRYVEAHHVQHWIDGGETRLENLVLLCSAHHRLLHHGAFHITVEDDDVVFVSRDGEVIERALRPQFPEVPAVFPQVFPREPNCPDLARPCEGASTGWLRLATKGTS